MDLQTRFIGLNSICGAKMAQYIYLKKNIGQDAYKKNIKETKYESTAQFESTQIFGDMLKKHARGFRRIPCGEGEGLPAPLNWDRQKNLRSGCKSPDMSYRGSPVIHEPMR